MEKVTKHGESIWHPEGRSEVSKKKDTMHEAVYKNTDPTEFRLLILKNTVLNTACEVHLVVWTPVQYKVQKTWQGKL